MDKRIRAICFTTNNYTEHERTLIIDRLKTSCRYYIIGREVGETGTPHLQGYAYSSNKRSFTQWKVDVGERSHIEPANGTSEQNWEYCSKGGDFEEWGEKPVTRSGKGKLGGDAEIARWDEARKAAETGDLDLVPSDIFIRHYGALKQIARDSMERIADASDVTGVWIYGEAGVGKSRFARHQYPLAYYKMANKWWDGYQDEEYVILDDLDPNHKVLGHHLKIWADRYAFIAEIKGGARMIRPKKFVVTSQYHPREVWEDEATRKAIMRRFTIVHIPWEWVPPVETDDQRINVVDERDPIFGSDVVL